MTIHAPVFHQATVDQDTLRQALVFDQDNKRYNWRNRYPVLAALDQYAMKRSATIFPDDCPNTASECYRLTQAQMPLDTGQAIALAASIRVPAALDDLSHQRPHSWLRLTPVHWRAGRDRTRLVALDDISIAESKQLLEMIAPWFAEWGWHIHVTAANQWFVCSSKPFHYYAPSLDLAASNHLELALPHGLDLKRWQTLLTEIQMAWFSHPVNQARQANGKLAINSIWLDNRSTATEWDQEKVSQWVHAGQVIQSCQHTDIHQHLAQLNHALTVTLSMLAKNKYATISFLGDTWQQNIMIQKPSIFKRLKSAMRTQKAHSLSWLETPHFDFLEE